MASPLPNHLADFWVLVQHWSTPVRARLSVTWYIRVVLVVVASVMAACGTGTPTASIPGPPTASFPPTVAATPMSEDETLHEDARYYATRYGVDFAEAVRRLQLMDSVGQLDAQLTTNEPATFAGLWIQHTPDFRVIAQFTRNGEATVRPYIEHGPLAHIVEVRSANATRSDLKVAQEAAIRIVDGLGIAADFDINVRENRAEVRVTDRARLDAALREANMQLPANVAVITVEHLAAPEADK